MIKGQKYWYNSTQILTISGLNSKLEQYQIKMDKKARNVNLSGQIFLYVTLVSGVVTIPLRIGRDWTKIKY